MTPDEAERNFDAESRERQRKVAAAERAKRERVVETARGAWVQRMGSIAIVGLVEAWPREFLFLAEAFERAAARYVETGSTEEKS